MSSQIPGASIPTAFYCAAAETVQVFAENGEHAKKKQTWSEVAEGAQLSALRVYAASTLNAETLKAARKAHQRFNEKNDGWCTIL